MTPQFEFDFTSPADDAGMREREAVDATRRRDLLSQIGHEWGLPLGQQVEVWLREPEQRCVGRLEMDQPPAELDRRMPLRLRIGNTRFSSADLSSCVLRSTRG